MNICEYYFDWDAFSHVPRDERQKLDSKSRKCYFLGYGKETKGYRLYDIKRGKVFHSRDVVFNEKKRVEQQVVEIENKRHFFLKYVMTQTLPESTEEVEPVPAEPPLRRSTRDRNRPDYFAEQVDLTAGAEDPKTFQEALAGPDNEKWSEAMQREMNSLKQNEVWNLVKLPEGRKTVGSNKWVFKTKVGADGGIERYKARLVAQGYSQKIGTDYDETFCPVVRLESLQTIVALAAQNHLKLHQIDVTTAFLNGELQEEVYMKQP